MFHKHVLIFQKQQIAFLNQSLPLFTVAVLGLPSLEGIAQYKEVRGEKGEKRNNCKRASQKRQGLSTAY